MTDPGRPARPRRAHEHARGMSEPRLNEIIAVIAAERAAAGARYAGLVAARQRAYRRHAAAKGLLTRARKDGNAARIAAAARREAEACADAGRIGDACLREMNDLVDAALGNLLLTALAADQALTVGDATRKVNPVRSSRSVRATRLA